MRNLLLVVGCFVALVTVPWAILIPIALFMKPFGFKR